ncbi:hypothetical protein B0T13DRAFT_14442 [Neurospora crassa]|nr:hypothetical protein B0T13DRAFT_14442 [Neurospora crassa]
MDDRMDIDDHSPAHYAGDGQSGVHSAAYFYNQYDDDIPLDPELMAGDDDRMDDLDDYDLDDEQMQDGFADPEEEFIDSDTEEIRAEIHKFETVRDAWLAEHRADLPSAAYPVLPGVSKAMSKQINNSLNDGSTTTVAPSAPAPRPSRPRRKLGPRKPPRPPPEIQIRIAAARTAFDRREYQEAINMVKEIIRQRPATPQAWNLLSLIHEELGNREAATMCLISGAWLIPKDARHWMNVALYCLYGVDMMDETDPRRKLALERAVMCYSQALQADKQNVEARTGKADALMQLGQSHLALAQYLRALKVQPLNIRTVRNLAEAALDGRDPRKNAEAAKAAYRHIIEYLWSQGDEVFEAMEGEFEWSDLRIYLEFFTILEQWEQGAAELKRVARWKLGRRAEEFWDRWPGEDREWDEDDERRELCEDYEPGRFSPMQYGRALPVDLRARLYVFRMKMGDIYEAEKHLTSLNPLADTAVEDFYDFPDCLKDIGNALLDNESPAKALQYFSLYEKIADQAGDISMDADILVSLGRCHMALGDKSAAEERFIAAIEDDEDNIEARVCLANMYEHVSDREGREEAFLLVRDAMNLEANQYTLDQEGNLVPKRKRRRATGPRKPRKPRDPNRPRDPNNPKKYVPRRLINAEKRKQVDLERTKVATKNYEIVQELQERAFHSDDSEAIQNWTRAARDLVEDFRSFKEFYPWDKYVKYLGLGGTGGGGAAVPSRNLKLAAMAERLRQGLNPENSDGTDNIPAASKARLLKFPSAHRGIPFSAWLDIFLSLAFALVRQNQHREAYVVCHAARDSVVWTATDSTYLIHVAWASCAVYAGDEETCVAIARYFMRDYLPGTDSYRMFAAMCRTCQTPVSWYTSGPAQKFILRQIKTMDALVMRQNGQDEFPPPASSAQRSPSKSQQQQSPIKSRSRGGDLVAASLTTASQQSESNNNNNNNNDDVVTLNNPQQHPPPAAGDITLDVALLTIYGHILFTTTSYSYALSYFARAASLDPENPLINLSIGLAYVHYALKRQATNRQYLLTQGFAFLFRYYRNRTEEDPTATIGQKMEAHFNMGRAYSLIGLGNLAGGFYRRVLEEAERVRRNQQEGEESTTEKRSRWEETLVVEAAYNVRCMCFLLGDVKGAKAVAERWLVLE